MKVVTTGNQLRQSPCVSGASAVAPANRVEPGTFPHLWLMATAKDGPYQVVTRGLVRIPLHSVLTRYFRDGASPVVEQ